jgi:hypothetical protein
MDFRLQMVKLRKKVHTADGVRYSGRQYKVEISILHLQITFVSFFVFLDTVQFLILM